MSAKVQWVDCKALNAPLLDTFETSCSIHQVFYRILLFLHKISKAYYKPRFQMYADVRPSQDNRVRDILAYSILLEKYAQKIFRIKLSII